jgi:hypothetical protein
MTKDPTSPSISPESPWGGEPLVGEGEIFGELAQRRGSSLFLGRFTMAEVQAVLEKKGFLKESRKRGFWPLVYAIDSSAYPVQRFQIFLREKSPELCMVDLKIREGRFDPRGRALPGFPENILRTLNFEWLTLQNPLAQFTEKRGALPGQQRPGLGMSKRIMDVLGFLGKRMHQDALLAFPAFYHNAVLFSRYFRFVNPEKEGEIQAIRRTFLHMPIKQLAWIVQLNCLRMGDGKVYEWRAEEQMLALRPELKDYFGSRGYRDRVRDVLRTLRFDVDWERFEEKAQED